MRAPAHRPQPAATVPARAPQTHAAARDALARGAWAEARDHLEEIIAAGETPEALEDLGLAAWWLDDARRTFASRERAYSLYRDAGEARSAARVAIWLVWDYLAFRGDFAVASGWLERARRLLEGHEASAEYGWLLIREGEVALFRGRDPATAIDCAARAAALGRTLRDRGVEFTALALEGLALVSSGKVVEGQRRLDEASIAATAGEVPELHAVGLVCCWQIFACERLRDYDRAAQWIDRTQEFTKRWGLRPLTAVCRTQYAGVLVWRGDWNAAEQELTASARELERARPAMTAPPIARLGDLRLRQGRFDEADELFERSASHPISRLGRAMLHLEYGNPEQAVLLLQQFIGDAASREATTRAGALELLVHAHVVRGDLDAAEQTLTELADIAAVLGTTPLAAAVASARGVLRRGREDHVSAAVHFGNAAELYEQSGAPFETARAWLDRAGCLMSAGGPTNLGDALRDARSARDTFTSLGATREGERATALVDELETVVEAPRPATKSAKITTRQVEILRLVAQGMSNAQIATRLRLSEHTVKRHIANLLTKLGLASRAAAVAHAAKEGLL